MFKGSSHTPLRWWEPDQGGVLMCHAQDGRRKLSHPSSHNDLDRYQQPSDNDVTTVSPLNVSPRPICEERCLCHSHRLWWRQRQTKAFHPPVYHPWQTSIYVTLPLSTSAHKPAQESPATQIDLTLELPQAYPSDTSWPLAVSSAPTNLQCRLNPNLPTITATPTPRTRWTLMTFSPQSHPALPPNLGTPTSFSCQCLPLLSRWRGGETTSSWDQVWGGNAMVRCGMMMRIRDYDRLRYEEWVWPGTATSAPLQDVFALEHTKKDSIKKGLYRKKKLNPDRKNKNKGGVKKVRY